jgi:hypothetical protein
MAAAIAEYIAAHYPQDEHLIYQLSDDALSRRMEEPSAI